MIIDVIHICGAYKYYALQHEKLSYRSLMYKKHVIYLGAKFIDPFECHSTIDFTCSKCIFHLLFKSCNFYIRRVYKQLDYNKAS